MTHIYGLGSSGLQWEAAATETAGTIKRWADEVDQQARYPNESLAFLADAGFLGLCIPAEFGGGGQSPGVFAAVVEPIAHACSSTAMIYVMHATASQTFVASTTLAKRESFLNEVAKGRHLTTLAFSERGSRSEFWAPVSRLHSDGLDRG